MKMKILLISLCLLLSACFQTESISVSKSATIVAFGDSLTMGIGASQGRDYPSVLSKLLGVKVVNAGVSGEVSSRGLNRLNGVLAQYNPEVVILLHGGNDILQRASHKTIKSNIEKMIKLIQSQGSKVILVGVPKAGILLRPAHFYTQLAKQYDLIYLKDILSDLLFDKTFKSDVIHLNNKGYNALATALSKHIKIN